MLATTLVVVLVSLLLANSVATVFVRVLVARAQATLDHRWLPADKAVSGLLSAYVDEESGERGFLLTGDTAFLQPYTQGAATASRLQRQLATELQRDATGKRFLREVVAAHAAWVEQIGSQITARREGPIPQSEVVVGALRGKALFDSLRTKLQRLSDRTSFLIHSELRRISDVQILADIVTAITVALALVAGGLALPVTRRMLTRPLERLLLQLQRVGKGDYEQTVEAGGAAELVAMAQSAEEMRQSLLRHSAELVHAQRTITLRDERDRLAADLHDRSIQRLFALGLSLISLAKRHPDVSAEATRLINETDQGIRELRGIIFNLSHDGEVSLRDGVDAVVRESARALGFAPALELRGPLDELADTEITGELLAVLREALSNVLRHAHASAVRVVVSSDGDGIRLVVADDGTGFSEGSLGHGLRNMEARAARLGGRFQIRADDEGTTLEWEVPLRSHSIDAVDPRALPAGRPQATSGSSSRAAGGVPGSVPPPS